jgi:hypothetical protein
MVEGWRVCPHKGFPYPSHGSIPYNIVKEYDFDRNGAIATDPNKKCWWICSNNTCGCHVWPASIGDRLNGAGECPFCSGSMECFHSSNNDDICAGDTRGNLIRYWTEHPASGKRYWLKYKHKLGNVVEFYGTYWNRDAHGIPDIQDDQSMSRVIHSKDYTLVIRFET